MWRKIWDWITLKDAHVVRGIRREAECDFCDRDASCYVSINNKSWRTCRLHFRAPQETLRGGS